MNTAETQKKMVTVFGGDIEDKWGRIGSPPKNIAKGPLVSTGKVPLHIYKLNEYRHNLVSFDDPKYCKGCGLIDLKILAS